MNASKILQLQDEYILGTYAPNLLLVKGQGAHVWDADGRRYLDFGCGISVCNLGHCHPVVTGAIQRQAATLVHVSNLYYNEVQPQLAAAISRHSFGGRVFFANSGAEANEGIIKFARKWGNAKGRNRIVCMEHSFHGRTMGTLAATDKAAARAGFEPEMAGFDFVPFNDIEALEKAIGEQTCAVLLEPVQGESGVQPASRDYLAAVRQLCDQQGVLLLFDEVQTGIGRTGHYFAHQHYEVTPDAMSMAKALGNGIPIGAFEIGRKWEDVLGPGSHASTFGGTPLACAAGLAVFQVIEDEDLIFNCRKMGEHLKGALLRLAKKHAGIKQVRGLGLMLGVQVEGEPGPVVARAAENGLLLLPAGDNVVRLYPPLNVTSDELDAGVEILDRTLGETS